jgi:tetratricopeptide (TPR) repeat protein
VVSQDTYDSVCWARAQKEGELQQRKDGNKRTVPAISAMLDSVVASCKGKFLPKGQSKPIMIWRLLPKGVMERRAETLKEIELGEKPKATATSPEQTQQQVKKTSRASKGQEGPEMNVHEISTSPELPIPAQQSHTQEPDGTARQRAEYLCNKAVSFHAKGRVREAIDLYRRALDALAPEQDGAILFNLGAALQAEGDIDGAVRVFSSICSTIDPTDAQAR